MQRRTTSLPALCPSGAAPLSSNAAACSLTVAELLPNMTGAAWFGSVGVAVLSRKSAAATRSVPAVVTAGCSDTSKSVTCELPRTVLELGLSMERARPAQASP